MPSPKVGHTKTVWAVDSFWRLCWGFRELESNIMICCFVYTYVLLSIACALVRPMSQWLPSAIPEWFARGLLGKACQKTDQLSVLPRWKHNPWIWTTIVSLDPPFTARCQEREEY